MPLIKLVRPGREHLASYRAALERGFSPNNLQPEASRAAELDSIARDPDAFLASLEDLEARGGPIELPDGTRAERLPGFRRWMWDGREALGSIGFRFRPGTAELPPHVLGHIGYGVVPWAWGRGVATRALALMLEEARGFGLPFVHLTTDPDAAASIRVIEKNGGVLVGRFRKTAAHGGDEALRWRIGLQPPGGGSAASIASNAS